MSSFKILSKQAVSFGTHFKITYYTINNNNLLSQSEQFSQNLHYNYECLFSLEAKIINLNKILMFTWK